MHESRRQKTRKNFIKISHKDHDLCHLIMLYSTTLQGATGQVPGSKRRTNPIMEHAVEHAATIVVVDAQHGWRRS